MSCEVVPFSTMPWSQGGHPLEQKKTFAPRALTLLRFEVAFEDPAWCANGHHIYVVDGALELELEQGCVRLERGDACVLDPGTRHRARNPGATSVTLFVFSSPAG